MIYYYFTSKEALFRTVVAGKLERRTHASVEPHQGVTEHLIAAQRVTLSDLDYVRLLQWEALEHPRLVDLDGRRATVYADLIDAVREDQAKGALPEELDAEAPAGLYGYQPDPGTSEYPLALISPASERTISSTLAELPRPEVRLLMHPDDAESRGLKEGDDIAIRTLEQS